MKKVAIIGAGVVGTAIGYILKNNGYALVGVASRRLQSAKKACRFIGAGRASTNVISTSRKADIVFITTSDNAIEEVCKEIALQDGFRSGAVVFHTCGALSSEILRYARKQGASIASLHPLQSLANVREAVKNLPGSYFCVEGDENARIMAREIIKKLGGKEIPLKVEEKSLYHAGASVASNFLVATVSFGMELFETAGINRRDTLKSLMPLIRGTLKNIETIGIPLALTGPIARGDYAIVEDHLKAICRSRPDLVNLYVELGRCTVKIATDKGTLTKGNARKIILMFDRYKKGIEMNEGSRC